MMQQWTGVNFIFFFGTTFFQQLVGLCFQSSLRPLSDKAGLHLKPLPDWSDHHSRQRFVDPHLFLDH